LFEEGWGGVRNVISWPFPDRKTGPWNSPSAAVV
jgi:hypothetical protein